MNKSKLLEYSKIIIVFFVISLIWGAFALLRFQSNELLDFGYTPKFIDIANSSIQEKSYTSDTIYTQYFFQPIQSTKVVDEVQREPFYSGILILVRSIGFSYSDVVYLQFAAIIIAITLWGAFIYKLFGKGVTLLFYLLLWFSVLIPFYSSVLYPYAFHFLFLTIASISLFLAAKSTKNLYFVLSGIFFGLAIYERNSYLLLPVLLAIVLILIRRFQVKNLRLKSILIFLIVPYFVLAPWLIRNLQLGVIGIDQISGYVLGYTYGDLKSSYTNPDIVEYNENILKFGTDAGTLGFIDHEVVDKNMSYTQADKLVQSIVLDKIKSNPKDVIKRVIAGVENYPESLIYLKFGNSGFGSIVDYYNKNIGANFNILPSYLIFGLSIFGLIMIFRRKMFSFGIITLSILVYSIVINTTIVLFNTKYREFVDLFIYTLAAYGIVIICKFIKREIAKYLG